MLKWIGGCLGLIVVAVGLGMWFGYRKYESFTSAPPIASVTIHAPASRVFASIADADSMRAWRAESLGITASRRGLLRVGDTVQVETTAAGDSVKRRSPWVVTAMTPGQLLALEARDDSSGGVLMWRRDSLVALGDSTQVVSTFGAPIVDSVRARLADTGRALIDVTGKLMLSVLRVQTETELKKLKARIEGRVVGDSLRRSPQ